MASSRKTALIGDMAFESAALGRFYFSNLFLKPATDFKDISLRLPSQLQWPKSIKWMNPLFSGFKQFASARVEPIVQDIHGVVLVEASIGDEFKTVSLDYGDYPMQIDQRALDRSILYFKMQYLTGGYGDSRVIPGQYIPSEICLYSFLPALRTHARKKTIDVYGRFGTTFGKEIRTKAVGLLREQSSFLYQGDLSIIRYSRYLREIAASKICIDMPGNGPFCFRLIEYLAMGSCIISPPHPTMLTPGLVDRKHIVYCQPDLSDLIDLCRYYLAHESKREEIGRNASRFFDDFLDRNQLAKYYLHAIRNALLNPA